MNRHDFEEAIKRIESSELKTKAAKLASEFHIIERAVVAHLASWNEVAKALKVSSKNFGKVRERAREILSEWEKLGITVQSHTPVKGKSADKPPEKSPSTSENPEEDFKGPETSDADNATDDFFKALREQQKRNQNQ